MVKNLKKQDIEKNIQVNVKCKKNIFSWFVPYITNVLIFAIGLTIGVNITQKGNFPFNINLPFLKVDTNQTKYKLINTLAPEKKQYLDFGLFWEVWNILQKDYFFQDKVSEEKMIDGSIQGLASSFGDPYTMYLPKASNQISTQDLQGSFYGIGIEIGYLENNLAVIAPLKNTPADKAGLKAGDLITRLKDERKKIDEDTTGWSLEKAVESIRGPKDSEVILTIYRKDSEVYKEPFEVSIKRDEIVVISVELAMIERNGKNFAHLKLNKFGERTYQEWEEKVKEITRARKVDGIVFDLRNNPGGFFEEAIHVTSDFVDEGVIVSQEGKGGKQDFYSKGTGRLKNYKTVVLVNKGSASASEIVAGALRDRNNTFLIGEKTFGKGTVQEKRDLANGAGLHITVAKWILPAGSWIHETGVPVNVEIKDDVETEDIDEVLEKGIEELLKM